MPFPVFFFSFVSGQFDKDWPLTYAVARLFELLGPFYSGSTFPAVTLPPAPRSLSSHCVSVGVLGGDSRASETLFPLRLSFFSSSDWIASMYRSNLLILLPVQI